MLVSQVFMMELAYRKRGSQVSSEMESNRLCSETKMQMLSQLKSINFQFDLLTQLYGGGVERYRSAARNVHMKMIK